MDVQIQHDLARIEPQVFNRLGSCPLCGSEVKSLGLGNRWGQPVAWQAGCEHCGIVQAVNVCSEPFKKATDEAVTEARLRAEEKWNNLVRGRSIDSVVL